MKIHQVRLSVFFALCFLSLTLAVFSQADYDGYIVCFKDAETAAYAKQLIASMPTLYADDPLSETLEPIYGDDTLFTVPSDAHVKMLEEAGLLAYSEPDYYCTLYEYDYAAEPRFAEQWSHIATGIQAAWRLGIYGNDVTVAVLDSGIYRHADMAENLLPGINFVQPNSSTPADPTDLTDTVGHGTKVAGVICAAVNGNGVVGAAHRAKVLPIKVAGATNFTLSYVAGAINKAIEMQVDVISMSFGTYDNSKTVELAVRDALDFNIIVVAAAGNEGNHVKYAGKYAYPASYDGVISVGNLAKAGNTYFVAGSSQHNDKVTIAAPGSSILTTEVGGGYDTPSGTSFSAPYVAAVAALAKSADKSLTPAHFKELLTQTADKSMLNGAERNDYYGYGILNAGALLTALAREQARGGFLSPIDRKADGSTTITCTNFSSDDSDFSLVAGSFTGKRPMSLRVLLKQVPLGASVEFDLTELQQNTGILRCYLLDSAFRPLSPVRQ